jgi:hypothetical protein
VGFFGVDVPGVGAVASVVLGVGCNDPTDCTGESPFTAFNSGDWLIDGVREDAAEDMVGVGAPEDAPARCALRS